MIDTPFITAMAAATGSLLGAAASIVTTWTTQRPQSVRAHLEWKLRLMSGGAVARQGKACCREIIEMYGRPNLTAEDLRATVVANRIDELDPLKAFSNACRSELLGG